jgi:hypothetical protein
MKKTFRIKVIVRNSHEIFKDGLEPGVLGYVDLDYDLSEEEYSRPMFAKGLMDQVDHILNELVYTELEEIT